MSRVGRDLVEAIREMVAYLRGEASAQSYLLRLDVLDQKPLDKK